MKFLDFIYTVGNSITTEIFLIKIIIFKNIVFCKNIFLEETRQMQSETRLSPRSVNRGIVQRLHGQIPSKIIFKNAIIYGCIFG